MNDLEKDTLLLLLREAAGVEKRIKVAGDEPEGIGQKFGAPRVVNQLSRVGDRVLGVGGGEDRTKQMRARETKRQGRPTKKLLC